ncbi:MAG: fumarylacetoacetate hydrolase family protein [Gammaproteobacteria bacterium]|nr:fumarylacetoacetate hydrolase family protein [Gammaproteobacteria bacterium]
MKLISFLRPNDNRPSCGIVVGEGVIDLGAGLRSLKRALGELADLAPEVGRAADWRLAELRLLPVIPDPEKILCVGFNYRAHIQETGNEPPARPLVFVRLASSQVAHGQPILRPRVSERLDFEGELAVVIGRRGRYVPREDALGLVAGYACYNDGSIRDFQRHATQYTPGKNFPSTGAFGPWLATPEEVGDIRTRTLTTRLNGSIVQQARLDDLLFDIPALIEYCSTFTELVPGDVLVTGTPAGVGAARKPPLWMKPGDVVEVEISGVGLLRNPVAQED